MQLRFSRRQRDERGAFAVLFALLVVLLVTIAALGTDIGNMVSRKTDTQNQADFAALSAAQKYPGDVATGTTGSAVPATVVADIAASFNNNQPQDDDSACWRDQTCVTTAQLTDCPATPTTACIANGEVRFSARGRLRVVAPQARVEFGLASVFSESGGASVQSEATVGVFSAGPRILPMFAVSGCDWGRQTLTSPSTAEEIVPDLEFPDENGPARPNEPTVYDASNNVVTTLTPGGGPYYMVIDANQWQRTWKLGFFRESGDPRTVVVQGTDIHSASNTTLPAGPPVTELTGTTAVHLEIPASVYAEEGTWWIRAWGGKNTIIDPDNEWSPINPSGTWEAPSIQVGTPVLECDAGPTDGNFGTLALPRSIPYTPTQLPANIALGLVDGISLTKHLTATASGLCEHGVNDAIESDTELRKFTNCVDTDTGLPANVATEGLITYNSGNGLLAGKETAAGCSPDGDSDERGVDVQGNSDIDYYINDDVLSCFLLPGKTLAEVTSDSYAGGPAFKQELYDSPRFAYVPVFGVRPDSGGSGTYSIVDFRPAFITDQDPACAAPSYCASSDNGLVIDENGITHMKVVFFSMDARPSGDDVPVIDFLGVGDPVVRLVD